MGKKFPPAYVFCYTERTLEAIRVAKLHLGLRFPIDVKNSAPPFDCRCVRAWATSGGENFSFENGPALAIVTVAYGDIVAHIEKVALFSGSAQIPVPSSGPAANLRNERHEFSI